MCYVSLERTPWDALPVPGSLSSCIKQKLGVSFSVLGVRLSLPSGRKDPYTSLTNFDEANVPARDLIRRDLFLL